MTKSGKIALAVSLICFGVAGRLMPHAWNFTPIIAIALVAGHYLGPKFAVWIPLAAMVTGDYWLGFYEPKLMAVVYLSLAAVGYISGFAVKRLKASSVLSVSAISSLIFYLATNWAVWQFSIWYPKTVYGLIECYAAGLPFLRNAIIGDIFYTIILFLVLEFGFRYLPSYDRGLEKVRVSA